MIVAPSQQQKGLREREELWDREKLALAKMPRKKYLRITKLKK